MKISDLQDVPAFTPVTAESVWHEWWADTDVSAPDYRSGLARIAATDGIPLGLVTHIGRGYVGSVLLIENDLEARPQYTPWIAALWVEPQHRRQGVAATLIRAARDEAARLGHVTCYPCAAPKIAPCYLSRGFHLLETDVESLNVLAA